MTKSFSLKNLLLVCSIGLVFAACSSKSESVQEFDKPALYWYNKLTKQIANFDLEGADDTYTSLESEHRNSPLLPTSLLILANAHMDEEEYALANFYLDEYIKKFSLSKDIDYVRYLKIKANFLGFTYQLRDQQLIDDTITQIAVFKSTYPKSLYLPLIDTMESRLFMAKSSLDKEISGLYKRIGKPTASKIYEQKAKESWSKPEDIKDPDVPFYRSIFE